MHSDAISILRVQVARHGDKYAWKLYSGGHYEPIKFSVPIFLSEDAAHAAGHDVRARYLVRLARSAAKLPRIRRAHHHNGDGIKRAQSKHGELRESIPDSRPAEARFFSPKKAQL
ncbi:MAG: hypothetical protein WB624_16745 [Xanthobacteraceae bacterium]|jgi:hypothetical protein